MKPTKKTAATKSRARAATRNTAPENPDKGTLGRKGEQVVINLDGLPGVLAGRLRMLQRAGIQYKGNRDIFATAGYPRFPQFDDYESYYNRNELGGRIIDIKPKTTWRVPPEIQEPDMVEDSDFVKQFGILADRLQLWSEFEIADRRAGIGRYSVIFIGTRGTEDIMLQQPLVRVNGPEDILYIKAYDEKHAPIRTWVTDTANPRFGLPATYQLILSDAPGFNKAGLIVDASRVIHVAEDADDRVYGRPRLERVLNRIFDVDKIAASTAESYWQAVARILQAKMDPLVQFTDDDKASLQEQLGEMVHDLRRQFVAQGASLEWLNSTVSPVKDIASFYFSLIAVGIGVPQRVLIGNEEGRLASTTDESTYFGIIDERQEHFAEPILVRAFIDRMLEINALPAPSGGDDEYDVVWQDLFKMTEQEQADANLKRAQAAQALTPVGGDPTQLVEVDDDGNVWLVAKKPGNPDDVLPPMPAPTPPVVDGAGGPSGGEPVPAPPVPPAPAPKKPTPASNLTPRRHRRRALHTSH